MYESMFHYPYVSIAQKSGWKRNLYMMYNLISLHLLYKERWWENINFYVI